jgi:hypothetical protein
MLMLMELTSISTKQCFGPMETKPKLVVLDTMNFGWIVFTGIV